MPDNANVTEGDGTIIVAADEIAGVKHQRVKVQHGADGSATDVSTASPLPVVQTGALPAGTAAIGKLAANSGVDIGDVDVTSLPALPAGTNNIGDVDVLTLPALPAGNNNIGDVDVASIAAGDNNIGNVDIVTLPALPAGNNNIGDVDVASIAAGEAHIGEVGGNLTMITTAFTRPADTTAYAAGDAVGDSTSALTMQALANAARVSGGSGYIVGLRVTTNKKSITPRIRVHFWNTNGATLSNDNAAFQSKYADISKRVGYWDMPAMITPADTTNSDQSTAIDMTVRIPYTCAATNLYYTLETLDIFTPASGDAWSITVFCDRN